MLEGGTSATVSSETLLISLDLSTTTLAPVLALLFLWALDTCSVGVPTMAAEPSWLTIDELCEHLRITRDTAYAYAKKGMPSHKVGQRYRFDREEVDEWVKQGGAAAPSPRKRKAQQEEGEAP